VQKVSVSKCTSFKYLANSFDPLLRCIDILMHCEDDFIQDTSHMLPYRNDIILGSTKEGIKS
jgi:hypothetical protein